MFRLFGGPFRRSSGEEDKISGDVSTVVPLHEEPAQVASALEEQQQEPIEASGQEAFAQELQSRSARDQQLQEILEQLQVQISILQGQCAPQEEAHSTPRGDGRPEKFNISSPAVLNRHGVGADGGSLPDALKVAIGHCDVLEAKMQQLPAGVSTGRSHQQLWRVLPGSGPRLVRDGPGPSDPEIATRLAPGAIVEELALQSDRLQYSLRSGEGPQMGWVAVLARGRPLLVRHTSSSSQEESPGRPRTEPQQQWQLSLLAELEEVRNNLQDLQTLSERDYQAREAIDQAFADLKSAHTLLREDREAEQRARREAEERFRAAEKEFEVAAREATEAYEALRARLAEEQSSTSRLEHQVVLAEAELGEARQKLNVASAELSESLSGGSALREEAAKSEEARQQLSAQLEEVLAKLAVGTDDDETAARAARTDLQLEEMYQRLGSAQENAAEAERAKAVMEERLSTMEKDLHVQGAAARESLTQLQSRVRETMEELAEERQRVEEAGQKLQESEAASRAAAGEHASMQALLSEEASRVAEAQARGSAAESRLVEVSSTCSERHEELLEALKLQETLREEISRTTSAAQDAEERARQHVKVLHDELSTAKQAGDETASLAAQAELQLQEERQKVRSAEVAVADAENAKSDLLARLARLEEECESRAAFAQGQREQLQGQLDSTERAEQKLQDSEVRLQEAVEQQANLEVALEEERRRQEQLQAHAIQLEADLGQAWEKFGVTQQELQAASDELQAAQAAHVSLQEAESSALRQLDEVQQQLSITKVEGDGLVARAQRAEAELTEERRRVARAQEDVAEAERARRDFETLLAKVQEECVSQSAAVEAQRAQRKEAIQRATAVGQQLEEAEVRLQEAVRDCEATKEAMEEQRRRHQQQQQEAARLEVELGESCDKADKAQKESSASRATVAMLQKELSAAKESDQERARQAMRTEAELEEERKKVWNAHEAAAEAERAFAALKGKLAALEKACASQKAVLEQHREQLNWWMERSRLLEGNLDDSETKLRGALEEADSLRAAVADEMSRHAQLQEHAAQIEADLVETTQRADDAERRLQEALASSSQEEGSPAAGPAFATEAELQLRQVRTELAASTRAREELGQKMARAEAKLEEECQRVMVAEEEVAVARHAKEALERESATLQQACDSQSAMLKEQRTQLVASMEWAKIAEEQLLASEAKLEEAADVHEAMKGALSEEQDRYAQLEERAMLMEADMGEACEKAAEAEQRLEDVLAAHSCLREEAAALSTHSEEAERSAERHLEALQQELSSSQSAGKELAERTWQAEARLEEEEQRLQRAQGAAEEASAGKVELEEKLVALERDYAREVTRTNEQLVSLSTRLREAAADVERERGGAEEALRQLGLSEAASRDASERADALQTILSEEQEQNVQLQQKAKEAEAELGELWQKFHRAQQEVVESLDTEEALRAKMAQMVALAEAQDSAQRDQLLERSSQAEAEVGTLRQRFNTSEQELHAAVVAQERLRGEAAAFQEAHRALMERRAIDEEAESGRGWLKFDEATKELAEAVLLQDHLKEQMASLSATWDQERHASSETLLEERSQRQEYQELAVKVEAELLRVQQRLEGVEHELRDVLGAKEEEQGLVAKLQERGVQAEAELGEVWQKVDEAQQELREAAAVQDRLKDEATALTSSLIEAESAAKQHLADAVADAKVELQEARERHTRMEIELQEASAAKDDWAAQAASLQAAVQEREGQVDQHWQQELDFVAELREEAVQARAAREEVWQTFTVAQEELQEALACHDRSREEAAALSSALQEAERLAQHRFQEEASLAFAAAQERLECQEYQAELNLVRRRFEQKDRKLEEALEGKEELQAKAAELEKAIQEEQTIIARLQEQAAQAEADTGQAWQKLDVARQELQDAQAAQERLKEEAATLTSSLREAENATAAQAEQRRALEEQSHQEQAWRHGCEHFVAQAEAELNLVRERFAEANQQLHDALEAKERSQTHAATLQAAIEEREAQVAQQLEEEVMLTSQLQARAAEAEAEVGRVWEKLQGLQEEHRGAAALQLRSKEDAEAELQDVKQRLDEATRQLHEALEVKEKLLAEVASISSRVQDRDAQVSQQLQEEQVRTAQLQERAASVEAETGEAQQKVDALQQELTDALAAQGMLKVEAAALTTSLQNAEAVAQREFQERVLLEDASSKERFQRQELQERAEVELEQVRQRFEDAHRGLQEALGVQERLRAEAASFQAALVEREGQLQQQLQDEQALVTQLQERAVQAEAGTGQVWHKVDAAQKDLESALALQESLKTEAATLTASLQQAEAVATYRLQEHVALEEISAQEHSRCQEYQEFAAQAEVDLQQVQQRFEDVRQELQEAIAAREALEAIGEKREGEMSQQLQEGQAQFQARAAQAEAETGEAWKRFGAVQQELQDALALQAKLREEASILSLSVQEADSAASRQLQEYAALEEACAQERAQRQQAQELVAGIEVELCRIRQRFEAAAQQLQQESEAKEEWKTEAAHFRGSISDTESRMARHLQEEQRVVADLQQRAAQAEADAGQVWQKFSVSQQELQDALASQSVLKEEAAKFSSSLVVAESSAKVQLQEQAAMEEVLSKEELDKQTLVSRANQAEAELGQIWQQYDATQAELRNALAAQEKLKQDATSLAAHLQQSESQVKVHREEFVALQTILADEQDCKVQLQHRAAQAEAEVGQVWQKFQASQQELRDGTAAQEKLKAEVASFNVSVKEAEQRVLQQLEEQDALREVLAKACQQHSEALAATCELQKQKEAEIRLREAMERMCSEAAADTARLVARIGVLEVEQQRAALAQAAYEPSKTEAAFHLIRSPAPVCVQQSGGQVVHRLVARPIVQGTTRVTYAAATQPGMAAVQSLVKPAASVPPRVVVAISRDGRQASPLPAAAGQRVLSGHRVAAHVEKPLRCRSRSPNARSSVGTVSTVASTSNLKVSSSCGTLGVVPEVAAAQPQLAPSKAGQITPISGSTPTTPGTVTLRTPSPTPVNSVIQRIAGGYTVLTGAVGGPQSPPTTGARAIHRSVSPVMLGLPHPSSAAPAAAVGSSFTATTPGSWMQTGRLEVSTPRVGSFAARGAAQALDAVARVLQVGGMPREGSRTSNSTSPASRDSSNDSACSESS